MVTDEDLDWNRVFFARLLAYLGTVPLIIACGPLMLLVSAEGGAKEVLIFLTSLCAGLLLALSLFFGRWEIRESETGKKRWRMGSLGTVIVGIELFLSVCLALGNVWPAMHSLTR